MPALRCEGGGRLSAKDELLRLLDEFEYECFMLRVEATETKAKDKDVRDAYERIREESARAIAAWNSRAERVTDDEWESYQNSVPATEENMAKFGWVRERTCHIEGSYYDELFDETCTNLSCGHAIWQNESPNYCSECGAKVVGE